jgi:hypothetical protein
MITWNSVIEDIGLLLTEYYQENPEEISAKNPELVVEDADKMMENIADYVSEMEAQELLERVIELKLYLED